MEKLNSGSLLASNHWLSPKINSLQVQTLPAIIFHQTVGKFWLSFVFLHLQQKNAEGSFKMFKNFIALFDYALKIKSQSLFQLLQ